MDPGYLLRKFRDDGAAEWVAAYAPLTGAFPTVISALFRYRQIPVFQKIVLMKVRTVIRLLKRDGWVQVRMKGSHRQFKHASRRGLVTVPGKPSDDLPKGTLSSIYKQAGLKK